MTFPPHPGRPDNWLPEPHFAVDPGVRLRPVPEMGICLAYTPRRPALHRLSATSWLLASLCDGRSLGQIEAGYRAALPEAPGAGDPAETVAAGVAQLVALGIAVRVAPTPTPHQPVRQP